MERRRFTHTALAEQRGFTLVEVLVAPIVIGILAGIAIPIFLSQREQARDTAAKSDLRNALAPLVVFRTEEGSFPRGFAADRTATGTRSPLSDGRHPPGRIPPSTSKAGSESYLSSG